MSLRASLRVPFAAALYFLSLLTLAAVWCAAALAVVIPCSVIPCSLLAMGIAFCALPFGIARIARNKLDTVQTNLLEHPHV